MIDLKESSVTFRLPKYMKDYVSMVADASGLSVGEYIRALLFFDMCTAYGRLDKIAQLRKAYESCNGLLSGSVVDSIIGEATDVNASFIDGLVKKSFMEQGASQEIGKEELVYQALLAGKKKVPVKKDLIEEAAPAVEEHVAEQEAEEAVVPVQESIPEPAATPIPEPVKEEVQEEPVKTTNKPKRPKIGSTNFMM